MPEEVFEVGDRVFLTVTKHFGTIVKVTIQRSVMIPDAPGARSYNIKLDDGDTIHGVYHRIKRVQP